MKNNAEVGARIAVELAALRTDRPLVDRGRVLRRGSHTTSRGQAHQAVNTEHKCKGDKQVQKLSPASLAHPVLLHFVDYP